MLVWVKKQEFWQHEALQDGLFLTMKEAMYTTPVLVNEDTPQPQGKRIRLRAAIELRCKTPGCAFACKEKKALSKHETSCVPKPADFSCKTPGCTFSSNFKAACTNHMKSCATKGVAAQPEIQRTEVVTPVVQVFACPHRGCSMTHTTKLKSTEHQRTHAKTAPAAAAKPKPSQQPKATSKKRLEAELKESSEDSDDGKDSDDGNQGRETPKRKRRRAKKPRTVEKPAPATNAGVVVTKEFRCPFCNESHDTSELAKLHQRKHFEPNSSSLEGAPPMAYRCSECPESHDSAERARLHRQNKHQTSQLQPRQSESSGKYQCLECPKSHDSLELARFHQQKHMQTRQARPTVEVETVPCPECKVYSGTPALVLAHVGACRASLTCPSCNTKCDSQAALIFHVLQCTRGKRPREDDLFEESWKPTRNRNTKSIVKSHWQRIHVQEWLKLVELEEYDSKFASEQVDGRILLQLTEETIKGPLYCMKDTHAAKFLDLRAGFN